MADLCYKEPQSCIGVQLFNQIEAAQTMQDKVVFETVTKDDLKLIVDVLSAYQHNTQYKVLLEKFKAYDQKVQSPSKIISY
ncbi:hypothetical protein [Paracoccus sp. JM45]|uniref:hypothetical protein n=1 Tax=Paracoccus sp. JM45 TaxID=2283626 RepID=UPI000E6C351D|nr:hypothetical protein [Paracoccus sp. JM45]RJE81290.1 hypothetical protein DWB67_01130 [Paracoccus sp. JM45]